MRYGDALELHGADLFEARAFPVFFGFSGVEYKHLTDHVLLDYPSETFDVVTSNGVLEHVHDDVGSVCEVDRVLKPGGKFVVDCLPSRWSYTEAIQRALGHNAHDKLYTIDFTRRLVEGTRLRLVDAGYSFVLPTMLYGFPGPVKRAFQRCSGAIWKANDMLERCWPLNRLASNLWFVFQKPGGA
jgi:SAM-dependent methyltransferase